MGAQFGQGLDLALHRLRLGLQRPGPADLQDAVDPPAGPGGHRHPAALGVARVADRGDAGGGERGNRTVLRAVRASPGHGGHAGRHVPPAGGLVGAEARVAAEGQGGVGAGGPDGDGGGAQRREGVFEEGLGDGLAVPGVERGALGRAQAHGDRPAGPGRSVGPGARLRPVRVPYGLDEVVGDLGDPVVGGLVDDVRGQFQRGEPGLGGQFGELLRGLGRAAAEPLDDDALGELDQGAPLGRGVRGAHLPRSRSTVAASRPTAEWSSAGCRSSSPGGRGRGRPGRCRSAVPVGTDGGVPAVAVGSTHDADSSGTAAGAAGGREGRGWRGGEGPGGARGPSVVQPPADAGDEVVGVDRLGHVVAGAGGEALLAVPGMALAVTAMTGSPVWAGICLILAVAV